MFPSNLGMVELRSTSDIPDSIETPPVSEAKDTPSQEIRSIVPSDADHAAVMVREDPVSPQNELSSLKDVSETSADSVSTNDAERDTSEAEKPALDYPKVNSKGRYEYEAEFLRSLQSHPLSLKKPDLPDLDIVQQVPLPHREKQTNRTNDSLPSYMAPSRNNRSLPPRTGGKNSRELRPSKPPINEKKKSLLPLSNIIENCSTKLQTIQDIQYLLGRKFAVPLMNNDAEIQERCKLFFDKDDVIKLVEKEVENHKKNNNFSLAYQVSALNGNLKETITEASRANQLNDWLVAMSASISREFWAKTALLYAMQLEKSGESAQAASYYSSLHRITDAVRVLLNAGLFKESLILVKNCAPFNTQLRKDILNAWAKDKESQDDLEFAAKIYVSNLESKEAARCLTQRKDDPKCQSLSKILDSATPLVIKPNCI